MTASQTTPFVGLAYIKITADKTVFPSPIAVTVNNDGSFATKLTTSTSLPAGKYSGNLTINVCLDVNCNSHLEGSPFLLPYDIEVISPLGLVEKFNLSELSPLTGAKDWETVQADPHHTGFIPVNLDPQSFNLRWRWNAHAVGGYQLSASVMSTGGNRLYVAFGPSWSSGPGHELIAYNEYDGSKSWKVNFDSLRYPNTNPPAYSNGKVYIVAGSQESTTMFGVNAATGSVIFQSPMSSQWESYLSPTVANNVVYSDGGSYGGMFAFDAITGEGKFFASLPQYDSWTPAVDESFAYAYMNGALHTVDILTGEVVSTISDSSYSWNGYSNHGAPVIGKNGSVLAGNMHGSYSTNALVNFNTLTKKAIWQISGHYFVQPAYAQGEFFVANNDPTALEARRESDGQLLWSWTPPVKEKSFVGNIVVTNNLVFVSTDAATYAVDRATHTTKWKMNVPGSLTLSANGILYINAGQRILAVNLR